MRAETRASGPMRKPAQTAVNVPADRQRGTVTTARMRRASGRTRRAGIADVTGLRDGGATGSWFEHDGGASGSLDGTCDSLSGSCEGIEGGDVDVELALRES